MTQDSAQQEVLIVTGMSGAGRSTVGNALEDLGWYVVDNLPPRMLRPLVDVATRAGDTLPKIAVVTDVRGGHLFSELGEAIDELRASTEDRKSTRLNSSHVRISYAVFCLKKKK